jgi:hypothetical protein
LRGCGLLILQKAVEVGVLWFAFFASWVIVARLRFRSCWSCFLTGASATFFDLELIENFYVFFGFEFQKKGLGSHF